MEVFDLFLSVYKSDRTWQEQTFNWIPVDVMLRVVCYYVKGSIANFLTSCFK